MNPVSPAIMEELFAEDRAEKLEGLPDEMPAECLWLKANQPPALVLVARWDTNRKSPGGTPFGYFEVREPDQFQQMNRAFRYRGLAYFVVPREYFPQNISS